MINITKNLGKIFSKPLPSTRSGVFYNTYPYPTKISPEVIAVCIASVTLPGDTVLDAFAGSGSTGIAALLAEHPTPKMIELAAELDLKPVWGKRNAILYEIGTYATFATQTITNRLKAIEYANAIDDFLKKADNLVGSMYHTKSPDGEDGMIRYTIWTEMLICPNCGEEVSYFQYGTSRNPVTFKDSIECPYCHNISNVNDMNFAVEEYFDKVIGELRFRKKRKLAWVYGFSKRKNWDRAATLEDEKSIEAIESKFAPHEKSKEIIWGELHRAGYHYGITHLHHFYTIRNYIVMSELWKLASTYPKSEADAIKLLLLSYNEAHCTLMTRVVAKHNARDFVLTGAQSGVLYISKLPVEKNILLGLRRKFKAYEKAYKALENCNGNIKIRNCSSSKILEPNQSVDFVFTDPPFGDFIPYAEVNQINELWLKKITDRQEEVIISNSQNKNIDIYRDMLAMVFQEIKRVAKDDCPIAIVFHAAKAAVWSAFSDAVKSAGLEIQKSCFLDKTQASFKQVVSKTSVQGDPLFLLRKKFAHDKNNITHEQILLTILEQNHHETEIEQRHCYSLYIGKCMECGIAIQLDAMKFYGYIQNLVKDDGI